jgi:hypothetical protein
LSDALGFGSGIIRRHIRPPKASVAAADKANNLSVANPNRGDVTRIPRIAVDKWQAWAEVQLLRHQTCT